MERDASVMLYYLFYGIPYYLTTNKCQQSLGFQQINAIAMDVTMESTFLLTVIINIISINNFLCGVPSMLSFWRHRDCAKEKTQTASCMLANTDTYPLRSLMMIPKVNLLK